MSSLSGETLHKMITEDLTDLLYNTKQPSPLIGSRFVSSYGIMEVVGVVNGQISCVLVTQPEVIKIEGEIRLNE